MQMNAISLAESVGESSVVGLPVALGPVAIALVAIGFAAVLRRLGVAGAALLAGLTAGVLFGPGVMGRVAPDLTVRILDGDPAPLRELIALERERGAMNVALASPGLAGADASAAAGDLDERIARASAAWERTREAHRAPMRVAVMGLAALVLLGSGGATAVRSPIRRHHRAEALLLALWSGAASVGLSVVVMWLWGFAPLGPESLGLAAAASCGAFALTWDDRRAARSVSWGAAALIEQASRMATALAVALLVAATLAADAPRMRWLAWAALPCLPIGWMLRPRMAAFVDRLALPALTALCMLEVEPFRDLRIGLTLVLYLLLEDARWLGAWLGHWSTGRATPVGAMVLALAGMSVEPLIVALAALGLVTGTHPSWLAGSLLVAATAIALLAKVRAAASRRLLSADAELSVAE